MIVLRYLSLTILSLCTISVHFGWQTASVTITTHKQQALKHLHSNHVPVFYTKSRVNESLILKLKVNFEIKTRFWNQSTIWIKLQLKFYFEIELDFETIAPFKKKKTWFWNRGSILKSKLDFKYRFWNKNLILKSKLDLKIEA